MYSWFFQAQNQEWDILRTMLKNAGNMAVHDAAQQVDYGQVAGGRLVIDRTAAYAVFCETLEANLGLDDSLSPEAGSRLHSGVRIRSFDVVDEASGVAFPFLYENEQYGITKYIQGPSVIAVLETDHPVLIARAKTQEPIRVPAIQEYRADR